jgi:hypothetical protein
MAAARLGREEQVEVHLRTLEKCGISVAHDRAIVIGTALAMIYDEGMRAEREHCVTIADEAGADEVAFRIRERGAP